MLFGTHVYIAHLQNLQIHVEAQKWKIQARKVPLKETKKSKEKRKDTSLCSKENKFKHLSESHKDS